ncbi:hypothetical protein SS50377_20660 [Spironucleus salmonicida]|uniref:Uncharacterized protein n=1 Tax=Spironucleus salmonicida TaxID=348837 RepID=V6M7Q7_9EUKA|nr:hypothetical protein SS50377_20660 [Spironucleus salmonicida]|eukprot:EST49509.1 Hypothetical protein SS50377_10107 [Spironucleus salmonicida]
MKNNSKSFKSTKNRTRNSHLLQSISLDENLVFTYTIDGQGHEKDIIRQLTIYEQDNMIRMLSQLRESQEIKQQKRHEHIE